MTLHPLFDPADFRIPAGVAHVCAGGEPPFLRRNEAAMTQYFIDKSTGMPGRTKMEAQVDAARAGVARLWHVGADAIGFVSSVADGVSMVAESIDWRPGDNVCIDSNEYPSVVAPFALQRRPPVELRIAQGTGADRLAGYVDARTRVIGASSVSYLTGERFDLAALRRLADRVGALLVVDYTQAAGWMEIDASVTDFAFSACYKWLLGMTGVAVAYWNRQRQPDWTPTTAGWHSIHPGTRPNYASGVEVSPDALRFTRGNPAHGPVYVLASALDYLRQFDTAAVQDHVLSLTGELLDRLRDTQIPSTTPADPARHGANVCIDSPRAQAIVDALYQRGVYAWNGHGRARFSFHGYNCTADIDRIVTALREAWRG
jgi:cysteine desulfurase/selenocysteine lyase